MRAKMLMCEAATGHTDGTVSLLRGGLNGAKSTQLPIPFMGALFIRIESDAADLGSHQFDVRCMNEDGKPIGAVLSGTFESPQGGGANNIIMGFGVGFPAPGHYAFYVRVDNVEWIGGR